MDVTDKRKKVSFIIHISINMEYITFSLEIYSYFHTEAFTSMNSFSQISNYRRKLMRYGRYFSFLLNITILFLKPFKFTQNNVKIYFYRKICHRNKLLKYFFVVVARIYGFIRLRALKSAKLKL